MTLKEANFEVERLENEIEKLLEDKELLESSIDPKSSDYSKVMVDGGRFGTSVQEAYILKTDLPRWKDIDKRLQRAQAELENTVRWIDEELKILKKYDKTQQLIVYYKEQAKIKYTWRDISSMVNYSVTQCRRIYRDYKKKRDI